MPSYLHGRLGKLECKIAPPERPRRLVRVVASDEQEIKALAEAELEGFNRDEVTIIRLVGGP